MKTFSNPILEGFYPDPSICRVNEDYYLVTSSFEYYPGIPIFHSKDLVNWQQLGHVLDRPSQLDLDDMRPSGGIYAPSIRYHDGLFYVICTNVDKKGNFIVTSEDPSGPWSDPFWITTTGIDPSLFFDTDGKVYYTGNRYSTTDTSFEGSCEIWCQEIDLDTMTLVGDDFILWTGALKKAVWPEGPHIYQKDAYYYLMIAEGGTDREHAVTIARSQNLLGPYEGNPKNPILTHRHLGSHYPIVNIGHGDLVQTQNNEWWMVVLGSRPYGGYYRNLGRETFLVPLQWEDGWPIVNPGKGMVTAITPFPDLKEITYLAKASCDHFETKILDDEWVTIRTPRTDFYSLENRPGYLELKCQPTAITMKKHISFIGRRQQHKKCLIRTKMTFTPKTNNEAAGLVLIQNNRYHLQLVLSKTNNVTSLLLVKTEGEKSDTLHSVPYDSDTIYLTIQMNEQELNFFYGKTQATSNILAENIDGRLLSTDVAGGFVGTMIGMYATSSFTGNANEKTSQNHADFDWFDYQSY